MSRQDAYDCYNDEVDQVEEEFADGKISPEQRRIYLDNLFNNLQSDLNEEDQDEN